MPDSGRFIVAVPTRNEGRFYNNAFILDSKKEIRYMVNIDNPDDTFKLLEFSVRLGVDLTSNANGSDSNMRYSYIGSKGINLYTIYYNDYYTHLNTGKLESVRNIMGGITIIFFILFWLSLPLWVFMDASSRDFKASLWSILTLAVNIAGLLIYLAVRPEYKKCVNCEYTLDKKFIVCPYCGNPVVQAEAGSGIAPAFTFPSDTPLSE